MELAEAGIQVLKAVEAAQRAGVAAGMRLHPLGRPEQEQLAPWAVMVVDNPAQGNETCH
jgi:hypothetical protein